MNNWGGAVLRLTIALAVLAAGYLGMAWFLGRHVPSNTSVAGIPIGGKSPEDAEATLKRQLAAQASTPLPLRIGSKTIDIDPSAAGLTIDLPGTLEDLTGFSAHPADVWNHLTGGEDEPLKTDVDRARLSGVLTEAAKNLDVAAREGSITFPRGAVKVVPPVVGSKLSVDKTATAIANEWPSSAPVDAVVDTIQPTVQKAAFDQATAVARKLMSGPVKVIVASERLQLTPAIYAPAVSMKASGGKLVPSYDNAKLVAAVRAVAADKGLESTARDADVTFSGAKVVVVPARNGLAIDAKSVVAEVIPALSSASRTASVKTTVLKPKVTTAEAERTKPKEVISTFTTYFPDNPPRTNNIKIAVRTLHGTYVAPGETFSLNGTLGQRTPAKGYAKAPVIMNGRLTDDYGGGVSQVSTTLFNAAFFSGVKIEEYLAHSFYISRYPEGREATVSWPNVDQKWTNDTGYGILIQAGTSGNALTVTFHGTKVWDIESVKGPRRNVVQPKMIRDNDADCVPQDPSPGFDVTVKRVFKKNGETVKSSDFNTHYIPEDHVICTGG
jgi:vancomycin resistance protein YoaR